jgi:hypothetical protein
MRLGKSCRYAFEDNQCGEVAKMDQLSLPPETAVSLDQLFLSFDHPTKLLKN